MPDFPIVDAHVHVWDPDRLRYPWIEGVPALQRAFLVDDYREATASIEVDAIVFLQCECDRPQSMDEARWVVELAKSEPRIEAIVPHAPLEDGDACRPYLEELKSMERVVGVRRQFEPEPDVEFCLRPDFLTGLRVLSELEMSFDICISHTQMANVVEMVKKFPDILFILDHIGKPDIKQSVMHPWASDLRNLSEVPNVVCKVSGLVTEADHDNWTPDDLRPYLDHVFDCFGFDRVLFGGDWPVVTLAGTHERWVNTLDDALSGCSEDERRKLYSDNARRVYRIAD